MKTPEERIIERINQEIGSDIKNLHKSRNLVKEYEKQLQIIRSTLSLEDDIQNSVIKTALADAGNASERIESHIAKIDSFAEALDEKIDFRTSIVDGAADNLEKISELTHLLEYFKIVRDIQEISHELKSCVGGRDEAKIVGFYLALCGERESSNSIIGRLQNVEAHHLKTFANQTANYWHDILLEKFSKDFESLLKTIRWPYLGHASEVLNPSKDSMNKLAILAEHLFLIKPPGDPNSEHVVLSPGVTCPPISHPTQLLIKPFRQRFQFHFSGSKQTNRLDKPEWYFTQIINWAKDNHIFVGENFQVSASRAGLADFNVRLEFVRGLVQLAMEKLCEEIELIAQDEHLFAHLLDEVLSFEQDLKDSLNYPNTFPSAISVLTQAQYLVKWLNIERGFTTNKMDTIMTGDSPWEFIEPSNFEELKIPKCVDQFLHLLDAIRERYRSLSQPGHQLQFLQLQLELIDNFRRRLVQLYNTNIGFTKVLNAVNYLTSVLREWGENVHYLHLHAALVGPDAEEINSVFEKPVDELEHWQRKLVKELSGRVVDDIKAKSMSYRHDLWVTMPEQNAKEPFILSITAGEMFQIMMQCLHNLETDLSANVFGIVLRLIAHQLDDFFLDSMIMNTKFSTGGAAQFQFDMTRNLFPLFGQYIRKPELQFKSVADSCILLNLPRGSAILLHETLRDSSDLESHRKSLREVKVGNLMPPVALDVLERRTDICF
ncbi:RINT1-like protein [Phlebotomus argentipes]|uniref:RINT1-like protein n=1 Tax=Phlebotomus argentipes TaxID=94469 RepID=UPI0028934EC0|nr:RINT1-like protein [Phlebotomus argentipes]XP_059615225.1 RINT1-like protein [Phlebotomus argentipes]XP_059615226.1 RINT1-like protein [Phlebotomus argentipes]XP_059615227.1 RINT1-like protein [Phlebotomus argentipes]